MKTYRFTSIVMIVAILAGLAGFGATGMGAQQVAAKPQPIAIGAMRMNGTHLVPPSQNTLDAILADEGLPLNATAEQRAAAEKAWFEKFQKQSDTWVNPKVQEYVVEREKQLAGEPNSLKSPFAIDAVQPVTATLFALAVDFSATETFISDVLAERSIARSDIEDGRVIRGADALKMNIVDELGNLNDAIDGAKRMAASRR